MCNFMFTFCAYLAEGSLVAGSGTGSGLLAKLGLQLGLLSLHISFALCVCVRQRVCVYNFLVIQLSEFDKL